MKYSADIKLHFDLEKDDEENVSLAAVIDAVCDVFKVGRSQLLSPKRPAYLARARQAAYYLGWLKTKNSTPMIGRYMERDHTSVIYGRDTCIRHMKNDEEYAKNVEKAFELSKRYHKIRQIQSKAEAERFTKRVQKILEEESQRVDPKIMAGGDRAVADFYNSEG